MILHRRTHPRLDQPNCYACKLASVNIGAGALPTRRARVNQVEATEQAWHRDIPAYVSLRRQGYQPERIDGCDELSARASHDYEIEGVPRLWSQAEDVLAPIAKNQESGDFEVVA